MAVATTVFGISSVELQTPIGATIVADSGVNFVVGTAPIHRVQVGSGSGVSPSVNLAIVTTDISDFTEAFGFTMDPGDFDKWTLCEHAYRAMVVGNVADNVYNNVFDPRIHNTPVSLGTISLSGYSHVIQDPDVYADSVVITNVGATVTYQNVTNGGSDYILNYDQNKNCVITALEGGRIVQNASVVVHYLRGDVSR
jgi:hypothetical protein